MAIDVFEIIGIWFMGDFFHNPRQNTVTILAVIEYFARIIALEELLIHLARVDKSNNIIDRGAIVFAKIHKK